MKIEFDYLNHNGHTSTRHIEVDSVEFHHRPGWGYQPGWFVSGWDFDKHSRRSFSLSRIIIPEHFPGNNNPGNVVFRLFVVSSKGEIK